MTRAWLVYALALTALILIVVLLLLFPLMGNAHAQEHHERHHAYYQNWVNGRDKGCCNDQDCGELREDDERQTAAGVEIRIEGKWCPVEEWHYLKRGNAPNWASSHVCVLKAYTPSDPCGRLICYQPKPGT